MTRASDAGGSGLSLSLAGRISGFVRHHLRYEVLLILFVVMSINQADRAAMAIASPGMARQFHLDHESMGWLFASFAWAYMIFQLAGGWLIDRYGAKRSYTAAIFLWSGFTLLIGLVPALGGGSMSLLYLLIFLLGAAAAPSFPANSKFIAAWFPTRERGTASSAITSTQYFAAAVFTPLMAWVASRWNWQAVYILMGSLGIVVGILFVRRVHAPATQPRISQRELEELREGHATLELKPLPVSASRGHGLAKRLAPVLRMFSQRMMLGIFIGQYCISTLTFFFLTWFPVYLVQQRDIPLLHAGLLASVPALFGFVGGITGGAISDALLRKGMTLSTARKLPIYIGMGMSCFIVACNYLDSNTAILAMMTLAYFGKGMGAQGWAIIADTAPVNATGLAASIFNTFSSAAGIVTPIAIGYLVQHLHSFNGALIFVGLHALLAVFAFAFIAGPLKRMGDI